MCLYIFTASYTSKFVFFLSFHEKYIYIKFIRNDKISTKQMPLAESHWFVL